MHLYCKRLQLVLTLHTWGQHSPRYLPHQWAMKRMTQKGKRTDRQTAGLHTGALRAGAAAQAYVHGSDSGYRCGLWPVALGCADGRSYRWLGAGQECDFGSRNCAFPPVYAVDVPEMT